MLKKHFHFSFFYRVYFLILCKLLLLRLLLLWLFLPSLVHFCRRKTFLVCFCLRTVLPFSTLFYPFLSCFYTKLCFTYIFLLNTVQDAGPSKTNEARSLSGTKSMCPSHIIGFPYIDSSNIANIRILYNIQYRYFMHAPCNCCGRKIETFLLHLFLWPFYKIVVYYCVGRCKTYNFYDPPLGRVPLLGELCNIF